MSSVSGSVSGSGSTPDDIYKSESENIPSLGPLKLLRAKDIFSPNVPPVCVVGQSGSGKTVIAIDQVMANAKRCTGLVYFTSTYYEARNQKLRDMIPELNVKNYDLNTWATVWGEILKTSSEYGKMTSGSRIKQFIERHCISNPEYQRRRKLLEDLITDNGEIFKSKQNVELAMNAYIRFMNIKFIADNFRVNDQHLPDSDKMVVAYTQSTTPCPNLVFDDMTAVLKNPPADKVLVPEVMESGELSWKEYPGPKALSVLLGGVQTTMRGKGVAAFYIHTFPEDRKVRQQFGAFIIADQTAFDSVQREQTVEARDKGYIAKAWGIAKRYKHHKVVFYFNPDLTDHGQRVALFIAEDHSAPRRIGCRTYQAVFDNLSRSIRDYREKVDGYAPTSGGGGGGGGGGGSAARTENLASDITRRLESSSRHGAGTSAGAGAGTGTGAVPSFSGSSGSSGSFGSSGSSGSSNPYLSAGSSAPPGLMPVSGAPSATSGVATFGSEVARKSGKSLSNLLG